MTTQPLLLAAAFLLPAAPAFSALIHVPEDVATVTEAIAAARTGDEIRVKPGNWSPATGETFPLDPGHKDLVLTGAGPRVCALDAQEKSGVLRFTAGNSSVVRGFELRRARGPAVQIERASPEIAEVLFSGNSTPDGRGDALSVRGGEPRVRNALFVANGSRGPTVVVHAGRPVLEQLTFHANGGPAIEVRDGASPVIRACVFSAPGARGGDGTGIRVVAGAGDDAPILARNLFAECERILAVEGPTGPLLRAALNDAERAGGLREGDPRFVAPARGDFRLEDTSPARPLDGEGEQLGAFGGSKPLAWSGPDETTASDESESAILGPSVPNPARRASTVHFRVRTPAVVDLAIYNVLGQRVRTLHAGDLPAGDHTRAWDGRDELGGDAPPGIYFVRVTQGKETESRRLALVH